ncbi:MAG: hypothetical protein KBH07_06825 [Flavobacteriales bacterium]|nr:hypothetical protein [Flavobacteriales bacterium]MBP9080858.1 hypothetical protein [Flavobacteriales bacterium]
MERPERYDPEDLEHLMLERSFDELLAEERAYALRHLKDRSEYERMRTLLQLVQQHRHASTGPLDSDPAVRERVLHAFRARTKPGWRIWLNSVGGTLLPQRPADYWRPALALGVVALVAITVVRFANSGEQHKALAVLKPAPAPPGPKSGAPAEVNNLQQEATADEAPGNPDVRSTPPAHAEAKEVEESKDQTARAQRADGTGQEGHAGQDHQFVQSTLSEARTVTEAKGATMDTYSAAQAPAQPTPKDELESLAGTAVHRDTAGSGAAWATNTVQRKRKAASSHTEDDLLDLLQAAW